MNTSTQKVSPLLLSLLFIALLLFLAAASRVAWETRWSEEDRISLYNAFFTTKDSQSGTGLSLASAYGIIEDHKGWIEVESVPNEGTSFHIYLPCIEKKEAEKAVSA